MTFEGWDKNNPYEVIINIDNSFTIKKDGETVHTSRPFRLRVQAEGQAQKWLQREIPQKDGITLDVHKLSVDADALFRRVKNG